MTPDQMRLVLANVTYPNTTFAVAWSVPGEIFLQVEVDGTDIKTGKPLHWKGRKWRLSRHMTKSEIVQTAFLAVLQATEHEVRESFQYKGAAIFGPHFNVDRLASLAIDPDGLDVRADQEEGQ